MDREMKITDRYLAIAFTFAATGSLSAADLRSFASSHPTKAQRRLVRGEIGTDLFKSSWPMFPT
jgi:hypothetical protein